MKSRPSEKEQVQRAMRQTSSSRMYERYLAVLLFLEDRSFAEIARTLKRTHKTVSGYIHSYKTKGLQGLELGHSPGKPRSLTKAQEQQFAKTIATKSPVDVGFEAKYTWTLALAAAYVKREFQVSFTQKGISKVLHRLRFSYSKATYTLAKADKQEQAEFRNVTFPALKKSL